ncbi:hypothetical protein GUI12_01005 [Anaplasmataceae bacterium AB001_6]|nr:hypothetical protein GUI12_01005 [Anaplasmataceae bacterium AB001_6]
MIDIGVFIRAVLPCAMANSKIAALWLWKKIIRPQIRGKLITVEIKGFKHWPKGEKGFDTSLSYIHSVPSDNLKVQDCALQVQQLLMDATYPRREVNGVTFTANYQMQQNYKILPLFLEIKNNSQEEIACWYENFDYVTKKLFGNPILMKCREGEISGELIGYMWCDRPIDFHGFQVFSVKANGGAVIVFFDAKVYENYLEHYVKNKKDKSSRYKATLFVNKNYIPIKFDERAKKIINHYMQS